MDIISDHAKTYVCPDALYTIQEICRKMKFRYWRKAANSLHGTGVYIQARNFSEGGGYAVYTIGKEGCITKQYDNVHPRKIENILKIIFGRMQEIA